MAAETDSKDMIVLDPVEILKIPVVPEVRTDRKLLILKGEEPAALLIEEPNDIIEIEENELYQLPELLSTIQNTESIKHICIFAEHTFCILDPYILLQEYRREKE